MFFSSMCHKIAAQSFLGDIFFHDVYFLRTNSIIVCEFKDERGGVSIFIQWKSPKESNI